MKRIITRLQKGAATTAIVPTILPPRSPDQQLGELFAAVQLGGIHTDGKTFVDAIPKQPWRKLVKAYEKAHRQPDFDLSAFVREHFVIPSNLDNYHVSEVVAPEVHISNLWDILTRRTFQNKGSLLALPHSYIVPGGRFEEQFYWDSYFIMLGLAASKRYDAIDSIIKNITYMIRRFGMIPTANRTYFLTRSHPPLFAHMVGLVAERKGRRTFALYLPYLLREYQFWMNGSIRLSSRYPAHRRVVRVENALLNRYYDARDAPRPESYSEDVETAQRATGRDSRDVYRDLRAAAESGWDFSSRWLRDPDKFESVHTTEIIPVDLNCLLADLEQAIATGYTSLRQPALSLYYKRRAAKRSEAIRQYCWNTKTGIFHDYDFVHKELTKAVTLATVFPLFSGIATQPQSDHIAKGIKKYFLKSGGLVTTTLTTGEQWDAPNGWAPLHYVAVQGLRRYGHTELADEIRNRWMDTNLALFDRSGKFVEKYDMVHPHNEGGGGEYTLQDGFGWTNGVLMSFLHEAGKGHD